MKTILVVDDTPTNIDFLVALLQDNYKVKAAINGEKALRIVQSPTPPDLILMDIVLPGKDGIEICEILKNDATTADIPIVFISDKATGDICDRGMDLGGTAYMKKPLDPDMLQSILEISLPAAHC